MLNTSYYMWYWIQLTVRTYQVLRFLVLNVAPSVKQSRAFCGSRPRPSLTGAGAASRRRWEQWPLWTLFQPHIAGKPPGAYDGAADQSFIPVSPHYGFAYFTPYKSHFAACKTSYNQKWNVTVNRSDMHRWMAAFPNPTNLAADEDEVIYDDWGERTTTSVISVLDSKLLHFLYSYTVFFVLFCCVSQTVLRCSV